MDIRYSVLAVTRVERRREQELKEDSGEQQKPGSPPKDLSATLSATISEEKQDIWEDVKVNEYSNVEKIASAVEKDTIMKDYYDSPFDGHFGASKSYARIRSKFYWKGMHGYTGKYIKHCKKCQINKKGRNTRMPITYTSVSQLPFGKLCIPSSHELLRE